MRAGAAHLFLGLSNFIGKVRDNVYLMRRE